MARLISRWGILYAFLPFFLAVVDRSRTATNWSIACDCFLGVKRIQVGYRSRPCSECSGPLLWGLQLPATSLVLYSGCSLTSFILKLNTRTQRVSLFGASRSTEWAILDKFGTSCRKLLRRFRGACSCVCVVGFCCSCITFVVVSVISNRPGSIK